MAAVCAVCCWVSAVVPKATHAHSELTSWQGRGQPLPLQDQPRLLQAPWEKPPPPFPSSFFVCLLLPNHHFQPWPIAHPLLRSPFPGQPSQVAQSLGLSPSVAGPGPVPPLTPDLPPCSCPQAPGLESPGVPGAPGPAPLLIFRPLPTEPQRSFLCRQSPDPTSFSA